MLAWEKLLEVWIMSAGGGVARVAHGRVGYMHM